MTATSVELAIRPARLVVRDGGNRDLRLLWIGRASSELGSVLAGFAIPLIVLRLSGSAVAGGLAATVSFLATWLFSIPGGYLADRLDRRLLMIATDLVRGVVAATVAAAAARGYAGVWLFVIGIAVSNCAWMTYVPASTNAVRGVVTVDRLPEAVATSQVRSFAAGLAGPPLGGALFAWSHALPFLVDALSFAVSFGCVAAIRVRLRATDVEGHRRRPGLSLRRTLAMFGTDPFLRSTTSYAMVMNFAVSALLYVLILGPGSGRDGVAVVSAGLTLAALAGVAGSLVAPPLQSRFGLRAIMVGVAGSRAAAVAVAAIIGSAAAAAVAVACVTLVSPVVQAAMAAAQTRRVPTEVFGVVTGGRSFLGNAMQPLAPLAAGLLLAAWSAGGALVLLAAVFGAAALFAGWAPALDDEPAERVVAAPRSPTGRRHVRHAA
jgi:MFS family permease